MGRSAAQRLHSLRNLRPFIPRPKYVSIEACDRINVPALLAAQPASDEEKERGYALRVVDGQRLLLKRSERWPGAWFWFLSCQNPSCRRAFAGRGVEYALRLPGGSSWGCRHCLPVTWASRRYKPRSPARSHGTPLHRAAVRRARERRQHDRAVRRVDQLLAPEVEQMRQKCAESVEERQLRRNTELAKAMIRAVAEQGAVEVEVP